MMDFSRSDSDRSILKDTRKVMRTASLFKETIDVAAAKNWTPLYTLKDQDIGDLPSAYRIYMEADDETDAALKLVGSMRHWRKLVATEWFMHGTQDFDGLKLWREDMKARDEMRAMAVIQEAVESGDLNAAKKLYELTTKKPTKQVGRPSRIKPDNIDENNKIVELHKRVFKD